MTARPVNRASLGMGGQLGMGESIMLQEKARYEEFRRQHAKQNRDLVRVNTQRLEEIQTLKSEKDRLQAIILEERAEKAALATELKRVREELSTMRSNSTREALDTLLAVVPTLRQLRQKLDGNSPSSHQLPGADLGNRYVRVNPYEDRVFIAASGQTNLADLTERTERESESDSGSVLGVNGSLVNRARSLSASPNRGAQDLALRRRRSVSTQDRPSPPVRAEESPVPPVNPMPLQIDASVPQTRKRRISGIDNTRVASPYQVVESAAASPIILANPVRQFTSTSRSAAAATPRERVLPDITDRPSMKSSEPDVDQPVDQGTRVRKRTSISTIVTSVQSREEPRTTTITVPDRPRDQRAEDIEASILKKREQAEHESTLIQMAGRISVGAGEGADVHVDEDDEGENGGRQTRRARKSVNYKEPSLHKKMRKPDGLESKNGAKLSIPTSASKSRTPSRQRSQGTDTPTPTPQNGIPSPDFGASPTSGEPSAPTGLMRLQEKLAKKEGGDRPELLQAAVRRKSVLPKSGRGDDFENVSAKVESTVTRVAAKAIYGTAEVQTTNEAGNLGKAPTPTSEAGASAAETTSSRRRLAQLSINALPAAEDRGVTRTESVGIKSTNDHADIPTTADALDAVTQKAKLGRRRSSLFRPTDI